MKAEELNRLQEEAYDHLWNGRNRMALNAAKIIIKERPNNSEAAIVYAWALLENGHPDKAMDYANLAVELNSSSTKARFYRGFILNKMSIFEGAISDLDFTIEKEKESLAWSYRTKAQAFGGLQKFIDAKKSFDLALLIDSGNHKEWRQCSKWYNDAADIANGKIKIKPEDAEKYLDDADLALEMTEYWFSLLISRLILKNSDLKSFHKRSELLELESMFNLFQFNPALKKAEEMKKEFKRDLKFKKIYKELVNFQKLRTETKGSKSGESQKPELPKKDKTKSEKTKPETPQKPKKYKTGAVYYPNSYADIFSAKIFDSVEEKKSGKRRYYYEFDRKKVTDIGIEVIFENPAFEKKDLNYKCRAVWYLNDFQIGSNEFELEIAKDWDSVIFSQILGLDKDEWDEGQAKVDIYIENFKVCEKHFAFSGNFIRQKETGPQRPTGAEDTQTEDEEKSYDVIEGDTEKSLEELLEELDEFIGLGSVKKTVRDYIDFIKFNEERKKQGLKSPEKYNISAVFLGNPGTGKTTIARLLGNIFRAMGILPKGHVIETDRSSLVGQYVGETAQKTEKIIESAIGGVLFIDEAYTLVKKGGTGQDFGQEAIDILLKRMEDKKGEFSVIVAGYPEEMQDFLNSNPGLKSRFTHTFNFDDYTPDELESIFDLLLEKEDYDIDDDGRKILKKELINCYRARDKSFGNARMVRGLFDDLKINLSKRYLKIPEDQRKEKDISMIIPEDVRSAFAVDAGKSVNIPIDEEKLKYALDMLNSLTGLSSLKKEVRDIVKLARFFVEEGQSVQQKIHVHSLFLGNPGTGKTTVARIYSQILSSLGILEKGHLVETDKQNLVAGYVGQTAKKTNDLIDSSMGGTLFIDEAYTIVGTQQNEDAFGKEALDTLLKRMEDDRGKFAVIAAGYTDEMRAFIDSNPGLKSRFNKTFFFEDFNPEELMTITKLQLKKKSYSLSPDAKEELLKYFNEEYRTRDKNFGNARIARNVVESALRKLMLRVADIPADDRKTSDTSTVVLDDLTEIITPAEKAKRYAITGNPEKLKAYLEELNDLAGLESVKNEVNKLIKSVKVTELRRSRGLAVIDKNLHSVFSGNPGTGKTTVARLLSRIYKEMGLLEKGHLVEVDRSDLVAGYQGQTAIKTEKVIQKSLGGTLFIDEAYTLSRGTHDFGQEAIDTLLKRMEDLSGKFIVIAAGYTHEMEEFVESNPGLKSRFTNFFHFDDYKPRQLLEIAHNIATQNGYKLDEGALQLLLEKLTVEYENRDSNFGNARAARNFFYSAVSNQEDRISELIDASDEDLITITYDDVEPI